jgi:hypothetical protein
MSMTEDYSVPREQDRPVAVDISGGMLRVTLKDGRIIATPIDWYPRLVNASAETLANIELGFAGIHWPDIDEDLSISGMLRGERPLLSTTRDTSRS